MFSQFFVQIFALYKFFRKNLRKKRRKFSMDPICLCRYRLVASKVIDWQGQGYSSEAIKGGWISSLVSLVFRLGLVGNIFWLL